MILEFVNFNLALFANIIERNLNLYYEFVRGYENGYCQGYLEGYEKAQKDIKQLL